MNDTTHWTYSKRKETGAAIQALLVCCLLSSGCDQMFEFVQGADWAAQNAVERYLDADKSGEPIDDFWCRPGEAKRTFEVPMSFEIALSHKEDTTGKNRDAAWFAFIVTARVSTERDYADYAVERYMAYVKKMPDGAFKVFGFVKESEAAGWESVKSRMGRNEDSCGFPR